MLHLFILNMSKKESFNYTKIHVLLCEENRVCSDIQKCICFVLNFFLKINDKMACIYLIQICNHVILTCTKYLQ